MKYVLAVAACFGIFVVYSIIAGIMGWKSGGGAIPMMILFAALIGTWHAMVGPPSQDKKPLNLSYSH